jgi:cell fate regulator YaaT (PSP1 superfamily)
MGCGNCSGGSCSPKGCGSQGHCASGGCNRFNTYDWLSDLPAEAGQVEGPEWVEVRFKANRKEFFVNASKAPLYPNEWVVVEAKNGYDMGQVTLKGELVRLQMRKRNALKDDPEIRKIFRKANEAERERLHGLRSREMDVIMRARNVVEHLRLNMKVTDAEFQGDASKVFLYYTAEQRVDFRELVRKLAETLQARVEMRQINPRQEAARLGGLGVCGRELCCSTWLTEFKPVSSNAARYQQLSINQAKLSGQCGRLKCCLNYELDTYLDALKDIPRGVRFLTTKAGTYECIKTDIFKKTMWFQLRKSDAGGGEQIVVTLTAEQVADLHQKSKSGIPIDSLTGYAVVEEKPILPAEPDYEVTEGGGLNRFDRPGRSSQRKKRKKPNPNRNSRGASPGSPPPGSGSS